MKRMLVILLILVYPNCKSKKIKQDITPPKIKTDSIIEVKNLRDFLRRSENDIINAGKVIIRKDIVKNLSHLQKMDSGGKHYYILERENITKMLQSVTEGVYTDFILINRKGTIIYTRANNDIFGKNVRSHLKNSPLSRCYINRNDDIYLEDVATLTPAIERHSLFAAVKVWGGNSFPGLFVLQISTDKIAEVIEKDTVIINSRGIIKFSENRDSILTPYKYFSKIDLNADKKKGYTFLSDENIRYNYRFFNYRNLSWIIIRKLPKTHF